jgi:hypothetical protein
MVGPTFEEWLATLTSSNRQKAFELLSKFHALGADDPETWVRSEVSEDLAQFTRYLVLRGIWPDHVASWARIPEEWTERVTKAADTQPNSHFADAGRAVSRVLAAGVSATDLGAIARMIAFETASGVLNRIDEGHDPAAGDDAPGWILMETDADGIPTGRPVGSLHEEVLSMDPTGREGKSS